MFIKRDDMEPFSEKVWLATPTMHGRDELRYIEEAFDKNWVTTAGDNVNEVERLIADYVGCKYAVGLSSGTAALHMCMKLAGQKIRPATKPTEGFLKGMKVFCSDITFDATVNPIIYEGGEPVFIDSEYETWNMHPAALEKAFEMFPEVRLVVVVNLYGTPAKLEEIRRICNRHGALLVEDAAESLGAKYKGKETGTFGDFNAISFNGNKIITASCGGAVLTDNIEYVEKVRKWSTQAREAADWYQHEELGYNYRISNITAGIARGQIRHLDEHIERKKVIYQRYREGFKNLPISMNPYGEDSEPNFWLSCGLIHEDALSRQVRDDKDVLFIPESGKSCPSEILKVLKEYNVEGRPVWKPMHMQPVYYGNFFVTADGNGRARTNAYIKSGAKCDVGADVFRRGLCLPSDIKMTTEQQEKIIKIVKRCFE